MVIIIFLIVINIFFNATFAATYNILSSDMVVNILLFSDFLKSRVYLPPDIFLLHYPLAYIILQLFGYGKLTSTIDILLLLFFTLGAFCVVYYYFIRNYLPSKKILYLFPLFLFINSSWPFYKFIANPILRNIEFGIVLLSIIYFDNLKLLSKRKTLTVFIYLMLLMTTLSDPYFLYLFVFPLLVTLLITISKGKEHINAVVSLLVISVMNIFIRIMINSTPYFFIFSENPQLTTLNNLTNNIKLTITGVLYLLNIDSLINIFSFVSLGFFFAGIYGLIIMLKSHLITKKVMPILLPLIFVFTILAYLFSNRAGNIETSRYLVFILFVLPFGICYTIYKITSQNLKLIFVSILLILSMANFIDINSTFYSIGRSEPYKINDLIIDTIHQNSVKHGFTSYWNAGLNTFLSSNTIQFYQVLCNNHRIAPYRWLSSERWYQYSINIGRTFLLIDFHGNLTPELNGCDKSDIVSQFGNPGQIVNIPTIAGVISLLIYDYNISDKFR